MIRVVSNKSVLKQICSATWQTVMARFLSAKPEQEDHNVIAVNYEGGMCFFEHTHDGAGVSYWEFSGTV